MIAPMVTVLHAIQWPLASLCGWVAGMIVRKRRLSWPEAYALALAPGLLIAFASALFGPAHAPPNEQPWQGLIIWAAWSAFGVFLGLRDVRKTARGTTLDLSVPPR
jgi:amino acid transporter